MWFVFLVTLPFLSFSSTEPSVLPPSDPRVKECLTGKPPKATPSPSPTPSGPPAPPRPTPRVLYRKVDPAHLPDGHELEGQFADFQNALRKQIANCQTSTLEDNKRNLFQFGCRSLNRHQWCIEINQLLLDRAKLAPSFSAFWQDIRERFDWYELTREGLSAAARPVLFTAYNNYEFEASATKQGEFQFPIYRKPEDLVQTTEGGKKVWRKRLPNGKFTRFDERRLIENENSLGSSSILGYAKSRYDLMSLHLEGSGFVVLRKNDGKTQEIQLVYEAENGHPHYPLSRILHCRNLKLKGRTQIEDYFKNKPEEWRDTLALNPNYVFFRPSDGGALGSAGVELTPVHSVAVDRKVIPRGIPLLYQADQPEGGKSKRVSRLAVAQDVGGMIKGLHIDTYWGHGPLATQMVNAFRSQGKLYIPLPKVETADAACAK